MKTELDDMLKQILLEDCIQCPELYFEKKEKPVKVYGKVAGLNCIGRSYFWEYGELEEKYQWAQQQMTNKYGAEMYGTSAQLGQQSANKSSTKDGDGTGTGTSNGSASSLISCTVSPLMQLPDKFVLEDGKNKFNDFWPHLDKICTELEMKSRDGKWVLAPGAKQVLDAAKKINQGSGPKSKDNVDAFNEILKVFQKPEWKEFFSLDKDMKNEWDAAVNGFKSWSGDSLPDQDGKSGGEAGTRELSSGKNLKDAWNPRQTYRIDIHTKFDENWYKRKFKSGLLNKLIFAIKTDARSHGTAEMNKSDPMANHKYTADEMLPQDTRKLDSLQWKMTNKVAKDFIRMFMGWTRKKERFQDTENGYGKPVQTELQLDESFGEKMADNALSGRGILGRLKQKIFSGGQSNNVISVAFQMADPNDGWTVVDEQGNPLVGQDEKQKSDGEVGGKEGGSGDGKGSGTSGGAGSGGSSSSSSPGGGDSEISDKQKQSILSILQRVINLEKQVYGRSMGQSTDESTEQVLDRYLMECL